MESIKITLSKQKHEDSQESISPLCSRREPRGNVITEGEVSLKSVDFSATPTFFVSPNSASDVKQILIGYVVSPF